MTQRHVPLLNNWTVRIALGLVCAVGSPLLAARVLEQGFPGYPVILAMIGFGWLPAVLLTDKYVHKYPQRYFTYVLASHLKAALIMAFAYAMIRWIAGPAIASTGLLAMSLVIFLIADLSLSLPYRNVPLRPDSVPNHNADGEDENAAPAETVNAELGAINGVAILEKLDDNIDRDVRELLHANLAEHSEGLESWALMEDRPADDPPENSAEDLALIIGGKSLNTVARLNLFLQYCTRRLAMGGFLAVRYTPLDVEIQRLKEAHQGFRYNLAFLKHFIWYRAIPKILWVDKLYFSPFFSWIDRYFLGGSKLRNRVISTAEVWGRLAYYGFEVVAESGGEERHVLARRIVSPISNQRPSFYAVVALEKVGLDGVPIRLHKVRSMYPFSEFLQKQIFESHGLSDIGKFKDDPRLTDYGPMIRRKWLDELPGVFDWLRGDVKLVGMRATSPHFLSLYPKELYDLYIQIKPGLVPPIFDESTDGFDDIVRIEMAYLRQYLVAPIKTDIQYFWYTLRDIFFRKVRSQ